MDGDAIARWVRRHSAEDRFREGLALCDAAIARASEMVRAEKPDATPRDIRAAIKRMRGG